MCLYHYHPQLCGRPGRPGLQDRPFQRNAKDSLVNIKIQIQIQIQIQVQIQIQIQIQIHKYGGMARVREGEVTGKILTNGIFLAKLIFFFACCQFSVGLAEMMFSQQM